jgi:hypothetical protein
LVTANNNLRTQLRKIEEEMCCEKSRMEEFQFTKQQQQQLQEVLRVSTCKYEPIVRKRCIDYKIKQCETETLNHCEKSIVSSSQTTTRLCSSKSTTTLIKNEINNAICEKQKNQHKINKQIITTCNPHIRSEIKRTDACNNTVVEVSSTTETGCTTNSSEHRVYKCSDQKSEKTTIEK